MRPRDPALSHRDTGPRDRALRSLVRSPRCWKALVHLGIFNTSFAFFFLVFLLRPSPMSLGHEAGGGRRFAGCWGAWAPLDASARPGGRRPAFPSRGFRVTATVWVRRRRSPCESQTRAPCSQAGRLLSARTGLGLGQASVSPSRLHEASPGHPGAHRPAQARVDTTASGSEKLAVSPLT